jgi:formate-dependent nitrite reductase cytochrome c552 subunit
MFAGAGGSGVKRMESEHSKVMPKKCVTCHMYKEKEDKVLKEGGHTFIADNRACITCHEDPKSRIAEWRAKILPLLAELKELLDKATDKKAKAYKDAKLNYDLVIADGVIGMHNPTYAHALLLHSISSLRFRPTEKSTAASK